MGYLKIEITGERRSGKSTVGNVLLGLFQNAGLNVRLDDEGRSTVDIDNKNLVEITNSMMSLKDTLSIDIVTKTVKAPTKGVKYYNRDGTDFHFTNGVLESPPIMMIEEESSSDLLMGWYFNDEGQQPHGPFNTFDETVELFNKYEP